MNQMDQQLQEYKDQVDTDYRDFTTRLDMLETNQRKLQIT